jgi:hypothetical protein
MCAYMTSFVCATYAYSRVFYVLVCDQVPYLPELIYVLSVRESVCAYAYVRLRVRVCVCVRACTRMRACVCVRV